MLPRNSEQAVYHYYEYLHFSVVFLDSYTSYVVHGSTKYKERINTNMYTQLRLQHIFALLYSGTQDSAAEIVLLYIYCILSFHYILVK